MKVVGLNPCTVYWMDIFTLKCCKNCKCLFVEESKMNKRGHGWPISKQTALASFDVLARQNQSPKGHIRDFTQ